ncbi:MAG: YggS family pyridoxal phosphate-dependent enzyme, partial [Bacteroidales bacterium]|nr:YggS family pyridoxal phosphate-dependent enzyme [Bacteroidales bacterium]
MIKERINEIIKELPSGVKLVAVSKFHPVSALMEAYDAGQRLFGENRPQEFAAKVPEMPADVQWHFIGHLQTNKVNKVVGKVDLIESVDRMELLEAVNRTALRLGLR